MKTAMIPALALLAGSSAFAQNQTLTCSIPDRPMEFRATLDGSGFDPGSGLVNFTQVTFLDNFLTIGDMKCAGHDLESLDCIGFAFNEPGEIEEVTLIQKDGRFFANLATLKGRPVAMHDGPWPCAVQ